MNNNTLRNNAQLIEDRTWHIEQRAEREITRLHRRYLHRIDNLIETFISRYSVDGELDTTRIRQSLIMHELIRYITRISQRTSTLQQSGNARAMEVAARINASLGNVTSLEALRNEIDVEIANLYIESQQLMESSFREGYEEMYYRTSHSIATTSRLAIPVSVVTDYDILRELSYNWSGETYNNRLWNNRDKIVYAIGEMLSEGVIRGDMNVIARRIRDAIGWTSLWQIRRILRTEFVFFGGRGTDRAYELNDVEWYEIVETLDLRTCATCRALHGQIFPRSEAIVGINYNPIHPNCRGITTAHFPTSESISRWRMNRESREAQDISENMTFEEWFERYVI